MISSPLNNSPYRIRPLLGYEEYEACAKLQNEIWGLQYVGFCSPVMQWISQSVGGLIAGAFNENEKLLGFVIGLNGQSNGRSIHWSHMLGVSKEFRGGGIGQELKLYQRNYLLSTGVETIINSFDPLNSIQANISLSKLGAVVQHYKRDFYPTSQSPLHQSIGTDRLISQWNISSPDVSQKIDALLTTSVDRTDIEPNWSTAPLANHVFTVQDAKPRLLSSEFEHWDMKIPCSDEPDLSLNSPLLRLAIPHEINLLQELAPETAIEWRMKTRKAFESYFSRGYRAVALWAHPPFSSYLLTNEPFKEDIDFRLDI